jgi:RND family efflux transporter MFP subunit
MRPSLLLKRTSRLLPVPILLLAGSLLELRAAEIDGFTEPYHDIDVAAPEMGQIVKMEVREGDRVTEGQVLARLHDAVWNASLEVARVAMESAGRLEAAQAELRLYRETLEKLERLLQRQHATQHEVDRALSQRDAAEARVRVAQEELLVRAQEYERARTQLEQRRVLAPISGVVTQIYKDAGEFVSPSDPTVIKVVQLDPLLVVFSVPVSEARGLQEQSKLNVRIEPLKDPVQGTVEFISPTADAQSGTTRVRVRIPNPGERISSGANCQLLLPDRPERSAKSPRQLAQQGQR